MTNSHQALDLFLKLNRYSMKYFFSVFMLFAIVSSTSYAQNVEIYMQKNSVARYPMEVVDSIRFTPCFPDTLTVVAISPNADCATSSPRPTFEWEIQLSNRQFGEITHELTIVEMSVQDTSFAAFDTKKQVFVRIFDRSVNIFAFPATSPKLVMGKIYAWRVKTFENGKLIALSEVKPFYIIDYPLPFNIAEVLCCSKSLLSNGTFQVGNKTGILDVQGSVANWNAGYGSPIVKSDSDGCKDPGYIQLNGNRIAGSSIKQQLPATNKIIQGKHYRLSFCTRLRNSDRKNSDYVLIKAVAFNSSLPNTGLHPTPTSDIAIIGWTGKLSLKEWATASLKVWSPNKNFDNIAIYCYTNSEDTIALCDIDNICFQETTDSVSCDDYVYDGNGQPVIDSSMVSQAPDTTYNYYDEYTGLTSDLYSQQGNTTLDTWYPNNDPCASIGGFVPLEIQNTNFNDTLKSLGYEGTSEDLDKVLSQTFADSSKKITLNPIPAYASKCNQQFVPNKDLPFGGRDIIFVHGLQLKHLCDRAGEISGAIANWPTSPAEFESGGYYKKIAEDGWADHIKTWMTSKGYKNRYLIVSYNCSQPIIVAAHAMLTQIRNAMATGIGVVNLGDPRKTECFAQSSVIISHSTGGLVSDIAMSIAEKTKTDPILQAQFGNVGYIPDRVKGHIAFHSVLAGSKMATVFLALQTSPALGNLINSQICTELRTPSPAMRIITLSSILVDLQPAVVTTLWNPFINTTPVPTITIAGGHPYGVDGVGYLNWALHPGLDDGVSTMSSQSGNPNFETGAQPSGYFRNSNPFKVYDMGIATSRANSYYMNQTLYTDAGYVGSSGITHLSATGMLQPVASTLPISNPENRYKNHYSFIQSASDHYIGPRGKSPNEGFDPANFPASSGFQPPNYDYDESFGRRNYEESRAITNTDIYTKGLVSPLIATMQAEHIRGLDITIPIPIPNMSIKFPPLRIKFWWTYYYIVIPIWQRKYHNMVGYGSESEASYVYKYVLRQ